MTQDELEQRVLKLTAQNLILRDYLVWLLAREAGNSGEPDVIMRLASEFGDFRVDQLAQTTDDDLRIAEILRQEKDWIIAAAMKVLGG